MYLLTVNCQRCGEVVAVTFYGEHATSYIQLCKFLKFFFCYLFFVFVLSFLFSVLFLFTVMGVCSCYHFGLTLYSHNIMLYTR